MTTQNKQANKSAQSKSDGLRKNAELEIDNQIDKSVGTAKQLKDEIQKALELTAVYCFRFKNFDYPHYVMNKYLKSKNAVIRNSLPSMRYWFENVAGIKLVFDKSLDKYTSAKKQPESYISEVGIALTYDSSHKEKVLLKTFHFDKIAPENDLSKPLTIKKLDDVFKSVIKTLAAESLAGVFTDSELDDYLLNLKDKVIAAKSDKHVKARAEEYKGVIEEQLIKELEEAAKFEDVTE